MSSLSEKYGEQELLNISPFAYKEGLSVKESDENFPNIRKLQDMLLKDMLLTKRHMYIIQFIYELGFVTQKQIEWAMNGCSIVDPFVKNMATFKPYDNDVKTLLNLRVIRKGEILSGGKKYVRYYRLTPATEEWFRSCVTFDRDPFYSDAYAPRPSRMMNLAPEVILGELAATDFAIRSVVYSSDSLVKKSRFYLENASFMFSGRYTFENGMHMLLLPVRREIDYGKVIDALKLPNFAHSDYKLVVLCESVSSRSDGAEPFSETLKKRLKAEGLTNDSLLYFADDTSLKNPQRPTIYKIKKETTVVYDGFWEKDESDEKKE